MLGSLWRVITVYKLVALPLFQSHYQALLSSPSYIQSERSINLRLYCIVLYCTVGFCLTFFSVLTSSEKLHSSNPFEK